MQVKELKPSAVDVGEGGVEDREHQMLILQKLPLLAVCPC